MVFYYLFPAMVVGFLAGQAVRFWRQASRDSRICEDDRKY